MMVCKDCGTEATAVRGRRRGTRLWWCWKCEKHIRPAVLSGDSHLPE